VALGLHHAFTGHVTGELATCQRVVDADLLLQLNQRRWDALHRHIASAQSQREGFGQPDERDGRLILGDSAVGT